MLSRRWGPSGPHRAVAAFMLVSAAALWLGGALAGEVATWSLRAGLEVGFMGAACSVAYWGWGVGMRQGNFGRVTAFSYLTPLLSTVVSCVYLGIGAGLRLWLGAVMIVAGAWVSRRATKR